MHENIREIDFYIFKELITICKQIREMLIEFTEKRTTYFGVALIQDSWDNWILI